MMLYGLILVACYCLFHAQVRADDSPRIIIIGSGAAGVGAASRLLQNGFNNITILEAENRIGGRVHTTKFEGYWVDLGGQWVHGEQNNVAYELAWPLDLIEFSSDTMPPIDLFSSSGPMIPQDTGRSIMYYYFNLTEEHIPNEYLNRSIGEYYKPKINEFIDTHHPELDAGQRESLMNMFDVLQMGMDAGDSWFNVSVNPEYGPIGGDGMINWKDKGYNTIFDILMKKIPDPTEELPVLNKTILNAEVSQISYDEPNEAVSVITTNGDQYIAEHVIFTGSLGVLKADYQKLFNLSLPDEKINAIKGFEFGYIAKIYLYYEEPWWTPTNGTFLKILHWTEKDKQEFANDPEKSWMLSVVTVTGVEYKPRLLCCWLSGPLATQMEDVPEDRLFQQTKELLRRFFGRNSNLTEPTAMLRSQWFNNKHFRGTYSYRSIETERSGATRQQLAQPIMEKGKPILLFGGEATSFDNYGTVHGALASGWREADRLIQLYPDIKSTTERQLTEHITVTMKNAENGNAQ